MSNLSFNSDSNLLRILVATDNHLGFMEKDGVRGRDSFKTFEEILAIALKQKVDFLLLAGDLYHEARPTTTCLHESIRLMRKYCMGSNPVSFQILSDPNKTFANTAFPTTNYIDPNLNVGLPIFTIHGNHDDPNGPEGTCAVDLLHSSGLVNLFGKSVSIENLEVTPILFRKGTTSVALYGMGAQREERLHRLFESNSVFMQRPSEDPDDWFSLICVHQNRAKHGPTSYLPEHFIPNFFDLVIWGHEHECRLNPEWNSSQSFFVSQPGSSVATSLSDGEAVAKAVGLLEIKDKEFKMSKIPLKTVRPMFIEDILLEECPGVKATDPCVNEKIDNFLSKRVEEFISKAIDASLLSRQSSTSDVPPSEPLIRLKIDLSGGFNPFSIVRFGQKFVGRVANPREIISFNRKRDRAVAIKDARERGLCMQTNGLLFDEEASDQELSTQTHGLQVGLESGDVTDKVRAILDRYKDNHLDAASTATEVSNSGLMTCLNLQDLSLGLKQFVDKEDSSAIDAAVKRSTDRTLMHLRTLGRGCSTEEETRNEIWRFMLAHSHQEDDDHSLYNCEQLGIMSMNAAAKDKVIRELLDPYSDDSDQEQPKAEKENVSPPPPKKATRASGRTRAATRKGEKLLRNVQLTALVFTRSQ
ncbi:Double-strand break repair protein mre11a [Cichlidogyrus casuarinus]|uniref:Double-strand break repair protein n=1 Tax=Cichlidogyrus casuarinus TaxID=1844966 RepID=A0ABD2QEY6_9PLAT